VDVFKAKRANCCDLGDVFTRFCPMEVGRVAGEHNYRARRVGIQLFSMELITQSDVENARYHCVHSIFRVLVRHQLDAMGCLDPNRVYAGLRRMTDDDRKQDRWWKSRELFPVDVFGQD
jgi:hypothetical protein